MRRELFVLVVAAILVAISLPLTMAAQTPPPPPPPPTAVSGKALVGDVWNFGTVTNGGSSAGTAAGTYKATDPTASSGFANSFGSATGVATLGQNKATSSTTGIFNSTSQANGHLTGNAGLAANYGSVYVSGLGDIANGTDNFAAGSGSLSGAYSGSTNFAGTTPVTATGNGKTDGSSIVTLNVGPASATATMAIQGTAVANMSFSGNGTPDINNQALVAGAAAGALFNKLGDPKGGPYFAGAGATGTADFSFVGKLSSNGAFAVSGNTTAQTVTNSTGNVTGVQSVSSVASSAIGTSKP